MLTHLIIRNFAIIEHLEIPLHAGFTVLTGETGAGKSIIIDALNLLLGGRASTEVIRTDADQAVVEGVFAPRPEALARVNARLEARGIEALPDQVIVRRIVCRSGRNKVFVNGSLTTASALSQLVRGLVDISGQHEHYSLMDPEGHAELLDGFAELSPARAQFEAAWHKVSGLKREVEQLGRDVRDRASRVDFLRFQLQEIDDARLNPDEDDALEETIGTLRHAEKILQAGQRALYLGEDADASAAQQLSEAAGLIARAAIHDPGLEPLIARFDEVQILTEELMRDLRRHLSHIDADPRQLDALVTRSESLKRLKRKHGASIRDVLEGAEAMRQELDRLERAEERGGALAGALMEAEVEAFRAAFALSRARRAAATRLEQAVEEQLADLNMARTRFVVDLSPPALPDPEAWVKARQKAAHDPSSARDPLLMAHPLSAHGLDQVEFLIAPNVGEQPKPLARVASGGELSRLMLVMKSAMVERDAIDTYIFDEVDTGIGGSTADMVGIKIQRAAIGRQVLCITHLPQIASRCEHHYRVEKHLVDGRTQSIIRPLNHAERVEEIARMLGGTRVTDITLEAARELVSAPALMAS